MNKFLSLLALVTILSISAKAQEPQNVIKANPLGLFIGLADLGYERALTPKTSIEVTPSFGAYNFGGVKYSSVGMGADYRFYHSKHKNAPRGFYLSPGLLYESGKVSVTDIYGGSASANFTAFGVRGVLGKQWIWDSGFIIDFSGGIEYATFNYSGVAELQGTTLNLNGILPYLAFSLGYAF